MAYLSLSHAVVAAAARRLLARLQTGPAACVPLPSALAALYSGCGAAWQRPDPSVHVYQQDWTGRGEPACNAACQGTMMH